MKLIVRYLKPFVFLILLCLALLFGQAACDLSLPNLMSDMVNVGIQQGGLISGAPEAMNRRGLELLELFMTQEEKGRAEECYNTVQPESSEGERLSEQYPLLREEAMSVLRQGLDEESLDGVNAAYDHAAYALMLYLQKAGETGELEEIAGELALQQAQGGGQTPLEEENAQGENGLPEGEEESGDFSLYGGESAMEGDEYSLSSAPWEQEEGEGALLRSTEGQEFGETFGSGESVPSQTPEEGAPGAGDIQKEASSFSMDGAFDQEEGLSNVNMDRLYNLIPLLSHISYSSLSEVMETSRTGDSMLGNQVGVSMKRLFYREAGMDLDKIQSDYIWGTGLKMLGIAFLGVAAAVLVGLFSSRIAATVGRRLRRDLFQKVESFSGPEFDRFSTASLITRTTNDVQQVQMLVTMGIRMMCYAPIIGVGGVIFAVGKSVSMSWIVAAAVVAMLGLILAALAVVMPKFKSLQKLIDRLNLVSRENLSGMLVVRAFGNEEYEEKRFGEANRDLAKTTRFVQRAMSLMMPSMMFLMNVTTLVIVWVGGNAIAQSTLRIGDMMAFLQYAMQIISAFLMIAVIFVMVPRASVSAQRILEVLDMPLSIKDPEAPTVLDEVKGKVEFKDVSFRYGEAESQVLSHISFTALPGETTAIIGATGTGKSTLVNLIPRFYEVSEGEIDLDGVDIRNLSQKQLRDSIGYVPQKALLFSGTVASNLRYGKEDGTEEEFQSALSIAQAKDFVEEMPEGTESHISQGGVNVSGGQRQRLSIARALMKKAPVMIFDDSFSALDFKTDADLRRALREEAGSSTVILVAQRVSTILHAQQILVLDEGSVVGKGTHRELMESCPQYREIAESQLKGEELK